MKFPYTDEKLVIARCNDGRPLSTIGLPYKTVIEVLNDVAAGCIMKDGTYAIVFDARLVKVWGLGGSGYRFQPDPDWNDWTAASGLIGERATTGGLTNLFHRVKRLERQHMQAGAEFEKAGWRD